MSPEERFRENLKGGYDELATTCHIIDVQTLEIEHSFGVSPGFENTSRALPGDTYVMGGFNDTGFDGVGCGLINVQTGEAERWYITIQDVFDETKPEGGGRMMTLDEGNNKLYFTLFVRRNHGAPHTRLGDD
jgi:hypothetical protein